MPNFDGGHYFLTALIPVRGDLCRDLTRRSTITSHAHALREVLARLPTALQSPATERIGVNAPFSRDGRTHLARFVMIDAVAFNGRASRDALQVALAGPNPVVAEPFDQLTCCYLLFAADFDAPDGSDAALDSYLHGLWAVMETELRAILEHCEGYPRVDGAGGFARLVRDCQVETTMPFNDYWPAGPQITGMSKLALLAPLGVAAAALALGLAGALLAALTHHRAAGWLWLALAGLVGLGLAAWWAYGAVNRRAALPFPAAPRADLPSVLKALYLQQRFTRFLIDQQGADPASLHAAFGRFLAEHRPQDVASPTQMRGVVRS